MDLIALALTAKIIIVTATAGYRHESIERAEAVISAMGAQTNRFTPIIVRTEEEIPAAMLDHLASARVVMFVNTTGELAWSDRARLLDWIRRGGSFIGVHSASDTWHEWPEYIDMLGGEFETHPEEMSRSVIVLDRRHPATAGILSPHSLFEEYYRFKNFSPSRVNVLLALDDGAPMSWWRNYGAGRVFYTALGHREDVWNSPYFQQHLSGAIAWALGEPLGKRRRAVTK